MQPGIVGLRGAVIAAWEEDLRSVRQDRFDVGRGREALMFIQRFYGLVSSMRPQIQRVWGPGGHVHVVDSPDLAGPGPRVSQTRIKLRNHGEYVSPELFTHVEGTPRANPALGTERLIKVADVEPLVFVTELHRLLVEFLSVALNLDLSLGGTGWLYEHAAAAFFVSAGRWASVGDIYRRVTRELAVADSFESVVGMLGVQGSGPGAGSNGSNGANGWAGSAGSGASAGSAVAGSAAVADDGQEVSLSIEQLHRYVESQPDLENFVSLVAIAVAADQKELRVSSGDVAESVGIDGLAVTKLGRLLSMAPDVCRDGAFSPDYSSWSFLPSYNVHLFRRAHSIDDFLVVAATLVPRAAHEGTTTTSPGTAAGFKVEDGATLPDGVVTFLMTGVGGTVLKERGEGDSFFAVFPRATDAVVAAVEAQRAVQAEPWPDRLSLRVRMAVLTGEADALDRDYRSPAVNRCAKLRRRAVGDQILVSETTYSIVADILRGDIRLVSVGKRRLEGHDRPEEIFVVQHPEVRLEGQVEADEVLA